MMPFTQLDRITSLEPGNSITAIKCLSLSETYLKDHFPRFPVMPGVLMLEAMYQAGAWLVRKSEDFEHAFIVLRQARNVKYAGFVEPGRVLRVSAEMIKSEGKLTTLKVRGTTSDREKDSVSGRIVLFRYNLAEREPGKAAVDQHARDEMRRIFSMMYQPGPPG